MCNTKSARTSPAITGLRFCMFTIFIFTVLRLTFKSELFKNGLNGFSFKKIRCFGHIDMVKYKFVPPHERGGPGSFTGMIATSQGTVTELCSGMGRILQYPLEGTRRS